MRAIYEAPTLEAAQANFEEFAEQCGGPCTRRMIRSWETSWDEFVPFLDFPPELRRVVYTTNAIESLPAQFRRGVRDRGHFPNEQAALKVLYLIATRRRPNRQDLTGRLRGWKAILNPDHPLRRPHHRGQLLTMLTPSYTKYPTDPAPGPN